MTNRILLFGWFIVAVGLSLCWYPLKYLKGLQIGSPQLLFYAFAAASLCTIPWLACQAKLWRKHTESLLVIGLSGSAMLTLLHFSLASGDPLSGISIFCSSLSATFLLRRFVSQQALIFSEFIVPLVVLVTSISVLFGLTSVLVLHWTQFAASLAGISAYWFLKKHSTNPSIPVASKLASVFLCSTWLAGMVIIFSPRFVSFPYENAVLISALYGVLCLIPLLLSLLKVCSLEHEKRVMLWILLVLIVGAASVQYLDVLIIGTVS